jgi:hypothetical protein
MVRDRNRQTIFESGALNSDGSIQGNDNDADPTRFERHYTEITSGDQVEIYEPILGDSSSRVTTGLLTATGYLKDNRLLPRGFDKKNANKDIAVQGEAADDPAFMDGTSRVQFSVPLAGAAGPYEVIVELWYQPIGFRWAQNLKPYNREAEPRRFNSYYDSMASGTAVLIARATVTR